MLEEELEREIKVFKEDQPQCYYAHHKTHMI
jgi:hypothetical protein